jgi:serine/threonine-protein kinase
MIARRFACITVVAAVAAVAPTARADDRAAAQELFQQGKELMRAGDYANACPKLEAAAQLSSTAGVRLNLADCWLKLGRTASAWGKYDEALGIAERAGDSVAANLARKGRAQVEPHLVYLTVVVSSEAALPGLTVWRDSERLLPAAWGVAIPVDPGEHQLTAEAPGHKRWSGSASVTPTAKRAVVTLPVLEAAEVAPPPVVAAPVVAPPPPAPTEPAQHGFFPKTWQARAGWLSGGLGVVGVGLGTYFGISAISSRGDYRAHLTPSGQCADLTCQTDSHSAYAAGTAATAAFIAGGALLAGGVVLVITAPRPSDAPTPSAAVRPIIGPQVAGLGVTGSW